MKNPLRQGRQGVMQGDSLFRISPLMELKEL